MEVVALQLKKRIDVFLAVFVFKKYFDKVQNTMSKYSVFPKVVFYFRELRKRKREKYVNMNY